VSSLLHRRVRVVAECDINVGCCVDNVGVTSIALLLLLVFVLLVLSLVWL